MSKNNEGTIITVRGLQLLTKLATSAGQLIFTAVKVGTGSPPEETDPSNLTDLISYKMDGLIADYGYDNATMDGYVVMQISNADLETGFTMTEIGLYAKDPNLGEILYAYIDFSDDPNYIMPAANGRAKTVQMKLHIVVGEIKEIQATINPMAQVTRETFDREIAAINNEISALNNPEFDDSGTVAEITNYDTFMNSLISKMSIFDIFRNLKAGLKFILHTGQLVNNCVTNRADLPLSAAQGKALMDQLTVLNTNLNNYASREYFIEKNKDINKNYTARKTGYCIISVSIYGLEVTGESDRHALLDINNIQTTPLSTNLNYYQGGAATCITWVNIGDTISYRIDGKGIKGYVTQGGAFVQYLII